ncbi:NAD-dependent epimerase/dehydratase family protein [Rhodohalobacter sp. 614A]|uniref:NAD-dependent epimerase/dehydratase family protein n=1 Tax=Rhodohalobacter sp. 614A TaxID=2908649 RepID=UPI001F2AD9F9|nr:NAD-dependent epimerase/dehydratase family protein [Rhodohalobacter sp. 614A]
MATLTEHTERKVVYFSTCAISQERIYSKSPYLQHKRMMEAYVKQHPTYLIIRLPNLVGGTGNPENLVNLLARKVRQHEVIDIWKNSIRNILDVEDAVQITNQLVEKDIFNKVIKVASTVNYRIEEIVSEISVFYGAKPRTNVITKPPDFEIYPSEIVRDIIGELGLNMDKLYFRRILEKYFNNQRNIPVTKREPDQVNEEK